MFKLIKFIFVKLPVKLLRFAFGLAVKTAETIIDIAVESTNIIRQGWYFIKTETKIVVKFLNSNKINPFGKDFPLFLHNYILQRKTYLQTQANILANKYISECNSEDVSFANVYQKQFTIACGIKEYTSNNKNPIDIWGEFKIIN